LFAGRIVWGELGFEVAFEELARFGETAFGFDVSFGLGVPDLGAVGGEAGSFGEFGVAFCKAIAAGEEAGEIENAAGLFGIGFDGGAEFLFGSGVIFAIVLEAGLGVVAFGFVEGGDAPAEGFGFVLATTEEAGGLEVVLE
jgi:hypothetical protein